MGCAKVPAPSSGASRSLPESVWCEQARPQSGSVGLVHGHHLGSVVPSKETATRSPPSKSCGGRTTLARHGPCHAFCPASITDDLVLCQYSSEQLHHDSCLSTNGKWRIAPTGKPTDRHDAQRHARHGHGMVSAVNSFSSSFCRDGRWLHSAQQVPRSDHAGSRRPRKPTAIPSLVGTSARVITSLTPSFRLGEFRSSWTTTASRYGRPHYQFPVWVALSP